MVRRIPKKANNVKPQKKARYTQKTDSAGRRYTIDSTTGKRVRNELGDKEKAKSKKAKAAAKKAKPAKPAKTRKPTQKSVAPKPPKAPKKKQTRYSTEYRKSDELKQRIVEQAEKIRAQQEAIDAQKKREAFLAEQAELEAMLQRERAYFEEERKSIVAEEFHPIHSLRGFAEGIKERAEKYPRIKRALGEASDYARVEADAVRHAEKKGRPPTREEYVRARFLHALDNDEDMESVVAELADIFDYEVHDVYEIYFSPEVA